MRPSREIELTGLHRLAKPFLLSLVAPSMVVILTACATQTIAPPHAVVTKNVGTQNIERVEIKYGGQIVFRDMTPKTPGRQQTTIGENTIPEVMQVSWTLEGGRKIEQGVPLRRHIPLLGKLRGIEIQFDGPFIEVYRAMYDPNNPLVPIKKRIYP